MFASILAAAVINGPTDAPAQSSVLSQKAPQANQLISKAQSDGHVPVIVEFASPMPPSQLGHDPDKLETLKSQIHATQDAILNSVFGNTSPPASAGFNRGLQRFDITPAFAMNVTETELEALAQDPRVTSIQPNALSRPLLNESVPLIGMTGSNGAYAMGATGAGEAVAVVDTGVQSNHEFLAGKVVQEGCFSNAGGGGGNVSLCPNGTGQQIGAGAASPLVSPCINGTENICDHGTHVAGIAAGFNTNLQSGEPINGVAKDGKIVALQVFTRFNSSSSCNGNAPCVLSYTSDQIAALEYLYQHWLTPASGVTLASANMSLGGGLNSSTCDSDPTKPAIDALLSAGVATAIAAGNDGSTNRISAPGCISTAVTVGSTTDADTVSYFSNMSSVVDLLAPGGGAPPGTNILSSIATYNGSTTTYANFQGTSMATPHVAGAFAAIRSACPSASVAQILSALQSTGLNVTDTRTGGTITKPRIRVNLAVQQLGCGSVTPTTNFAVHDFNGNHQSDILWHQSGGGVGVWLMSGTFVAVQAGLGTVDTAWQIAGTSSLVASTGDFDGDGKADFLWRHSGGGLGMWLMNGTGTKAQLGLGAVDTAWQIAGSGDFDGDGKADMLWRHNGGGLGIWLMNGATPKSQVGVGAVDTAWQIAGIGDFDGDGKADILWRHSGGALGLWLMNGASPKAQIGLGSVDTAWQIVGVGDFDGDGKADILWRHAGGATSIWEMNGASIKSTAVLGTVDTAWGIVSVGDYDGDGKADILWRHTSGAASVWEMNGGSIKKATTIGTIDTSWTVVE